MRSDQFNNEETWTEPTEPSPYKCPQHGRIMELVDCANEGNEEAATIVNEHCQSCPECQTHIEEMIKLYMAEQPSMGRQLLGALGKTLLGAAAIMFVSGVHVTNNLAFGSEIRANEDFKKWRHERGML